LYYAEQPAIGRLINADPAVLDVHEGLDINTESLGNIALVPAPLNALSENNFTVLSQYRSPAWVIFGGRYAANTALIIIGVYFDVNTF